MGLFAFVWLLENEMFIYQRSLNFAFSKLHESKSLNPITIKPIT